MDIQSVIPVDFNAAIQEIRRYLEGEDYRAAVKDCAPAIEQALKQGLKHSLPKLAQADHNKAREAIRKRRNKSVDRFTLGDFVYFFRESEFLEAWERVSGSALRRDWVDVLDVVREFRNAEIHETMLQVTKAQAQALLGYLGLILDYFDLLSLVEFKQLALSTRESGKTPQPVKAPETLKLLPEDRRRLLQVVTTLVKSLRYHEIRQLLEDALEGKAKAKTICDNLHLDGAPDSMAREIIAKLTTFGRFEDRTYALGVFLNFIKTDRDLGDDDVRFIDTVLDTYRLVAAASPEPSADERQGEKETPAKDFKEIIIKPSTFWQISMLKLGLKAEKAVVHLDVLKDNSQQQILGTGFMVTEDLLITNNHVIATPWEAENSEYSFNYQLGSEGERQERTLARANPAQGFYTNEELDYTILRLEKEPGQEFGYLSLEAAVMKKGDRIAIIQHPGGGFKQISIQDNSIAHAGELFVQYTASTLPGSSGSPVFNDKFKVVAIHHSGGKLEDPDTKHDALRNEGTSSCAILKDLQQHVPTLYDEVIKASLNDS